MMLTCFVHPPVLARGSEAPHIDPVGGVGVFTPPPDGTKGCHYHQH